MSIAMMTVAIVLGTIVVAVLSTPLILTARWIRIVATPLKMWRVIATPLMMWRIVGRNDIGTKNTVKNLTGATTMWSTVVDAAIVGCLGEHLLKPPINEACAVSVDGTMDGRLMFTRCGLGNVVEALVWVIIVVISAAVMVGVIRWRWTSIIIGNKLGVVTIDEVDELWEIIDSRKPALRPDGELTKLVEFLMKDG